MRRQRPVLLDLILDGAAVAGDDEAAVVEETAGEVVKAANAVPDGAVRSGHESSMDERSEAVNNGGVPILAWGGAW
jgi:hypothetical protein